MSKYDEAIEYLYNATPQFQKIGAAAYKPGLGNAITLDKAFDSPHTRYPSIHIAGTNGKGSTASTIAAILQSAGYKTGLYTSPHLVDFRERIRINGEMISHKGVTDFVDRYRSLNIDCHPSFFELTTIMAFDWFAANEVDVAVIETGLGGRLDTTNIISPILSIITNISLDHIAQLGNSEESIAREKAGIIKPGIPVVIGEAEGAIASIFTRRAEDESAPIYFANESELWSEVAYTPEANIYYNTPYGTIEGRLTGLCQTRNAATILTAIGLLKDRFDITDEAVRTGFSDVTSLTGLTGRWTVLSHSPLSICDTGHNTGGWQYTAQRLALLPRPLSMVIGFVNDKDVDKILAMMPKDACYYFTRASIPRAMEASEVATKAARHGLKRKTVIGVKEAVAEARKATPATGSIFIGGSTFVVADAL
ncbi:MAG: bifunctional folylpolyglutamate synthase/dihydrofolate synthase [Bacteroidales bacterium]|nr:bifunctional folylpolyglutamate synthase/dihydrofolate synthase [Bacteroidales bacterium]